MAKIISLQDWQNDHQDDGDKRLFLTEKEVRSVKGFENISDEEVVNIIHTLHEFSLITYELIEREINQQAAIVDAA
jgi:predicted ATP-grasp superfamily ATP-dependent carboligase